VEKANGVPPYGASARLPCQVRARRLRGESWRKERIEGNPDMKHVSTSYARRGAADATSAGLGDNRAGRSVKAMVATQGKAATAPHARGDTAPDNLLNRGCGRSLGVGLRIRREPRPCLVARTSINLNLKAALPPASLSRRAIAHA
jgi:hypothetical protein